MAPCTFPFILRDANREGQIPMATISATNPDNEISSERLLTRTEVEEIFGCPTKRYLEIAAMNNDGPPIVRFGRTVRYNVGDLRSWIAAHRVKGEDQGSQEPLPRSQN